MAYNSTLAKFTNFEFRRIGIESLKEVQEFLLTYFATQGVLIRALEAPLVETDAVNAERTRNLLNQNAAIGVYEKQSGSLVAVSLGSIQTKGEIEDEVKSASNGTDFKWKAQINRLFKHLDGGNIFDKLGAGKIFLSHMLTVHPTYAKEGLGTFLSQKMINLGVELGCDYSVNNTSSKHAIAIFNKLGFTLLRSVDLLHYVDTETGTKPFANAKPPHTVCCTFYRRLVKPIL